MGHCSGGSRRAAYVIVMTGDCKSKGGRFNRYARRMKTIGNVEGITVFGSSLSKLVAPFVEYKIGHVAHCKSMSRRDN